MKSNRTCANQLISRAKDCCRTWRSIGVVAVTTAVIWNAPARAADEIQVYNAEIAKVGEWTVQQHLNYALSGRRVPDFPGGLVPNGPLNGTPEFGQGIPPWWEWGFYIPWAVDNRG